jgi:hypothetical protein
MKVSALLAITNILSKISFSSSITSLFRSIEIDKEQIRCTSEFGTAAILCDDTGITKPTLLDTVAVLAVARSLPSDSEITFIEKENRINWQCGAATGRWNIVFSDHQIPALDHQSYPWIPSKSLSDALDLAASACQAHAVSVGLYGIAFKPVGDDLFLLSSNSISLACSKIPRGTFPILQDGTFLRNEVTVRPPVPGIISTFVSVCPNCAIDITKDGIFIQGDWLKAHLPISVPLEHDLKELIDGYKLQTQTTKINGDAVRKFITRARFLSDRNTSFTITVKVEDGKLILSHSGIASSTEEFFIAEGLPVDIKYEQVALSADLLLIALMHVKTIVFDYLNKDGKSTLVLRGDEPEFIYVVDGEAK